MPIPEFDLDEQLQFYLIKMKLDHLKPDSTQYKEIERAFMGANAQMIMFFKDALLNMDGDHIVAELQQIFSDLTKYWDKQK